MLSHRPTLNFNLPRFWFVVFLGIIGFKPISASGQALAQSSSGNFKVLFFLDTECPVTQSYMQEIRALLLDYKDERISFEAVFPSYTVSDQDISTFFKKYKVQMSGQPDPDLKITKRYRATTMPEVVLLNNLGQTLYQGAIDNWYYALGKNRPKATAPYLRNALQASLNGDPILISKTEAVGCLINTN